MKMKKENKDKKQVKRQTKRLYLIPMTDEELSQLIENTTDEDLKGAYMQMLEGCKADPDNRLWYTAWKIFLKENDIMIGDAGFKGPQVNSSVEIGYGIQKEYEGNGYTTEAVSELINWAFENENVYFVEAETAPDNAASQKILSKLDFEPDGEGEEGPRFVLEKPKTSWMTIYMMFGMSIGMSLGVAMDKMAIGMSMGMMLGLLLGITMDSGQKKNREELRKQRKQRNER